MPPVLNPLQLMLLQAFALQLLEQEIHRQEAEVAKANDDYAGRVETVTTPSPGGGGSAQVLTYSYDDATGLSGGKGLTVTTVGGRETAYAVSTSGNYLSVTSITSADGTDSPNRQYENDPQSGVITLKCISIHKSPDGKIKNTLLPSTSITKRSIGS